MRYYQRKILPNHKISRPRRVLYFDIETNKEILPDRKRLRMKLGVTQYVNYDSRTKFRVPETRIFADWLTLSSYIDGKTYNKSCLYLISHNIGFDLWASGFLKYLTKLKWKRTFFYEQGLTFIFSARKDKRKIICLSTTNFFPFKLGELAPMVGLKKMEIDFDTASINELIPYCARDVEICKKLFESYLEFITVHNLGKFSYTRPSQSMAAFRHRFMHHNIYIHHQKDIQKLERDCYFGGRCEIWEQGKISGGPFGSLDVNSMYAKVMVNYKYPKQLVYDKERLDLYFLPEVLKKYSICAHCLVDTKEPLYAVRCKDKTVFPIGRFEANLCTKGIYEALSRGHLKKIYKCAMYLKDYLFRDYVNYFYPLKMQYEQQGNLIWREIIKHFLTDFYGKWGEQIPDTMEWDESGDDVKREYVVIESESKPVMMYKLLGKVTLELRRGPGRRTFTAIAAHVTEFARFYLSEIIEKIGFNRILYTDTDSIKIRYSDFPYLTHPISPDILGDLKFEGCTNNFAINSPKDYVWKGKEKIKGVSGRMIKLKEGYYEGDQFIKTKSLMKQGAIDYVDIVPAHKKLSREYTKAKMGSKGRFIPYCLPEDSRFVF